MVQMSFRRHRYDNNLGLTIALANSKFIEAGATLIIILRAQMACAHPAQIIKRFDGDQSANILELISRLLLLS